MKKIRPERVDFVQVGRFIAGAAKKLMAAREMIGIDEVPHSSHHIAHILSLRR